MAIKVSNMDKSDWIAVGMALGVVFILVFSPILFPNLLWPNTTPEDALNARSDCINRGDIKGSVDLSIVYFADYERYLEIIEDIEEEYESFDIYSISINNISVYYVDEMNLNAILKMKIFVREVENDYNISIEDYCLISYTSTQNINGEIRIENELIACIKVNSLWYIGPDYWYVAYNIPN